MYGVENWGWEVKKEIVRNISNKNGSRWGANFRRWEEWGEPEIPTKVMSWEAEETRDTMLKAIKKGIEQEIQEDWTKIENSSHFSIYKKKKIKDEIGRENYFEWKNVKESEIKIWTRARCGNTYNLGRFGRNSERGEEEDERKKENT